MNSAREEQDRASRIYSRFQAGGRNAMGRPLWESWDVSASGATSQFSIVLLLCLEPALWLDFWRIDLIPDPLALASLGFLPFQGWFLDQYLAEKTSLNRFLPFWLRSVRFLCVSLPVLSLIALPAWKVILDRRRMHSSVPMTLTARKRGLPRGLCMRGFYRSGFFVAGITLTTALPILWAIWLGTTDALGPYRRNVLLGVCVVLHLSSFFAVRMLQRAQKRRAHLTGDTHPHPALPWLWLLPFPGGLIGAFVMFGNSSGETLVWKAYVGRSRAGRLPAWAELRRALRLRWEGTAWFLQWFRPGALDGPPISRQTEGKVAGLYRLKTLTLPLEAGAFVYLASVFTPRVFQGVRLNDGIRFAMLAGTVLAGMGLVIHTAELLFRLLRLSNLTEIFRRHPYSRFLLLTQTAVTVGLLAGSLRIEGLILELGLLLGLGGPLCAILAVFLLLPDSGSTGPQDLILWAALYLSLAFLGLGVGLYAEGPNPFLSCLEIAAALSPLYGPFLLLTLGGWLLRPFSCRHVFDRRLPRRFRAALAFIIATCILPLGGLAIPFWIYARHRIWPRYEPFLSQGKGGLRSQRPASIVL